MAKSDHSAFSLLCAIVITGSVFYAYRTLYQLLLHPLKDIPGPLAARFSRFWELSVVRRGAFPKVHIQLHERYGPIVRIAPNRYSLSSPEACKVIYGHGSKFRKSDYYHAFGNPDLDKKDLFSEQDPQRHSRKRRMVASLYSVTTLLSYEKSVNDCNAELVDKLRKFAYEGRVIDVPTWMQYYAFDVIGQISVGKPFEYIRSEADPYNILASIHGCMVYGANIGLLPELHSWIAFIGSAFGVKSPFENVNNFLLEQILARQSGKSVGTDGDFLDKLLTLETHGKIERQDTFTTLGANVAAGSDTTAIGLSSVIYLLIKNPSCLGKLQYEIDEFAKDGRISNPVTFKEAQEMPYLQAVIKEALRIHPATAELLARVVPDGGVELDGYFFPSGTVVGSSPWVTHRNPLIFGAFPEVFRPERWLDDMTSVIEMDKNMLSFGAGSRTCIGRNISLLEMVKVIPQLFRQFSFELRNPEDEWELSSGWFVKQKFECRIRLR